MSGPWDDYAAPAEDGPWAAYAAPKAVAKVAPATAAPVKGPEPNAFGNVKGYMANLYRATGIGDEASVGLGTAASAVQDVVSGKQSIPNAFMTLGDRFSDRLKAERATEDDFAQRHPLVAANAKGVGLSATMLVPGGAAAPIANATRLGNMARGGLTAATTGAAYGLADRGTLEERGQAATAAGANPFLWALGAGFGALAPTAPKVDKPVDPQVALLSKEGVDKMTPGQIRGGWAKTLEDQATSLPIVGPAINRARGASIESFSRAPLNRALGAIDETLPATIASGEAAVKYAGDRLSAAYNKVLPEGGVYADQEFSKAVAGLPDLISTLTPARQKQVTGIISNRVMARFKNDSNVLSGDIYKQVESELNNQISRYAQSTDGDQRGMADALKVVKQALSDAAERQNPQFAAAKAKIDAGWAQLVPAERAASSTGAEGGVFSPAQYDSAVRAGSDTVRKRGYARGDALGQDLASAGRAVLPSKVPNSGTAERGMVGMVASIPGALAGAATGGGPGALAGIAATGAGLSAASRMYSESAIVAANKALASRIASQEQQAALQELGALAAKDPGAAQIYQQVLSRLPRAAGVGVGAYQAQRPNALAIGSQ